MVALFKGIDLLFTVYFVMILVRILSSWIPEMNQYRFMQFVRFYVDPYLNFFRRIIPPLGMIDLSPIVAIFALQILQEVLTWMLFRVLF